MSIVWLQGSVLQVGVGGGAGLGLGPETNQFTTVAARNTYATNNADWLAEYDANSAFLVEVTVSGTTTYYRRNGSAWEVVTNVVKGGKGDKGDTGDADEYFVLAASVAQTNSNKDITLTYFRCHGIRSRSRGDFSHENGNE